MLCWRKEIFAAKHPEKSSYSLSYCEPSQFPLLDANRSHEALKQHSTPTAPNNPEKYTPIPIERSTNIFIKCLVFLCLPLLAASFVVGFCIKIVGEKIRK